MIIEQRQWTKAEGWRTLEPQDFTAPPQLVLAFGARAVISDSARVKEIEKFYPKSEVICCSTSGEIYDDIVVDDSISLVAMYFAKTTVQTAEVAIESIADSYSTGVELGEKLSKKDLAHVMVFSDGLLVNGTSLTKGLAHAIPADVSITGGLVGDGPDFIKTVVGLNETPKPNNIVVVGLYGKNLHVGYGSFGGWDSFGPQRLITKSDGNILYEIDGKPALQLYKEYLGDQAKNLPISGLLFPVSLTLQDAAGHVSQVVRTVLSVNEKDQSMTFAGDMPEGTEARLMKANLESLINAAGTAAMMGLEQLDGLPELALLISCVGRKLVLKDRTEEEVDAVRNAIGDQAAIAGFYSYGEICPSDPADKVCKVHNQTMTITTFRED